MNDDSRYRILEQKVEAGIGMHKDMLKAMVTRDEYLAGMQRMEDKIDRRDTVLPALIAMGITTSATLIMVVVILVYLLTHAH